ncbi:MAG: hemin uptake protein HemP [Rhodocyclaceae bacterium]|nr:hemin uptake protein HemP [Rhodocyclaceae bacterium]
MMPNQRQTDSAVPMSGIAPIRADGKMPPILESRQLFGNTREVLIRHGTETYRLRQTQAGKLILTK